MESCIEIPKLSVEISGRLVFIGHPHKDVVFVFRAARDAKSFKLCRKLKCPCKLTVEGCDNNNNKFGASISVDGACRNSTHRCRILVGAPGAPMFSHFQSYDCVGGAFLFESDDGGQNWICARMFAQESPLRMSYFGLSVALHDTMVTIGAPTTTIQSLCMTRTGGVFVTGDYSSSPYHRGVPLRLPSCLDEYASQGGRWSRFGSCVAVSSNIMIVSSKHHVYVTSKEFSIISVFCVGNNNVVRSMCTDGIRVVVGAVGLRLKNCSSSYQGVVWTREFKDATEDGSEWTALVDPHSGNEFGSSVSLNGSTITVADNNEKRLDFTHTCGVISVFNVEFESNKLIDVINLGAASHVSRNIATADGVAVATLDKLMSVVVVDIAEKSHVRYIDV